MDTCGTVFDHVRVGNNPVGWDGMDPVKLQVTRVLNREVERGNDGY